jgi:hypothetical protein
VTQSIFGQTDALALAVASWLTSNSGAFCLPIVSQRRFRLLTHTKDIPTATEAVAVDVYPDTETSEKQGISTAYMSEYAIHIYIQQQTMGGAGTEEEQCALLTQLRSQILDAARKLRFDLDDAVHAVRGVFPVSIKSADKGLYDMGRLLSDNVYASDTILIFRASV